MAICCPKSINAFAMRLTRTDVCGVVESEITPLARILTDGFISVELAPQVDSGTETTVKKANGQLCVTNKLPDQLKWFDVKIMLCGIEYPVIEMLLGASPLLDGADIVGGVLPNRSSGGLANVQMELWTLNKADDACVAGATFLPYIHWMFPLTHNWQISGGLSFADKETSIELSGLAEQTSGFIPSIAAEWDAAQILAIQNGGPVAWKCVDALPSPIDDCAYLPIAS